MDSRVLDDRGFTLIELVVVLVILAAVSSMAVPRVFGMVEKARLNADKASVKILNTSTSIYKIAEGISSDDVFSGLSTDSERIDLLVENDYLSAHPVPKQTDATFKWHVENQLWRIHTGDGIVPLSPLGSDFAEISSAMIALIVEKGESGHYGRTWGDYRYTDIGLEPDDWKSPINHMIYAPSGKNLLVTPEEGYKFKMENENGESKTVWFGQNIIYDATSKNWYCHSIDENKIIEIDTLRVEN